MKDREFEPKRAIVEVAIRVRETNSFNNAIQVERTETVTMERGELRRALDTLGPEVAYSVAEQIAALPEAMNEERRRENASAPDEEPTS